MRRICHAAIGRLVRFRSEPRALASATEDSGFTLVEVLVALLLGAVGLLGTLAVQQAVINASKSANDASVALRLASQRLEEFSTVLTTGNPQNVLINPALPNTDQLAPMATAPGTWSPAAYLNAEGLTNAALTPEFRWIRRWRVVNLGATFPYVISVVVSYGSDSATGERRTVRLDMERRKSW
jgi:prepilin-type N-terminal cleavage/methylation domain-containing protein